MLIPYQELNAETLNALLEAYALREGTEYGEQDIGLETKVMQLKCQLEAKKIVIVYDASTESCDLMTMDNWQVYQQSL